MFLEMILWIIKKAVRLCD
uniref:Uncharacterized protein n=1 Tax=Anguilla anguilla TaxID=7936 RepID=A0A0E9Y032_ANGAN